MTSATPPTPISPWANPVTRALREGRVCIGACSISFPGIPLAQLFARSGFNFFYVDMEHSQVDYHELAGIAAAAKLAGITPIAGTTSHADHLIARPLDAGAMGVIVPHVSTPEQTADIVKWAKYAPDGERGLLGMGVHTGFETPDGTAWVEAQNREVLVAIKVESALGIENIEAIAAVPGLDAILVGPGDLSATMGIPEQMRHPRVIEAIERMLAAVKAVGIAGGPHVSSPEEAVAWAEKGATFMSFSYDGGLLARAATEGMSAIRAVLGDRMLEA